VSPFWTVAGMIVSSAGACIVGYFTAWHERSDEVTALTTEREGLRTVLQDARHTNTLGCVERDELRHQVDGLNRELVTVRQERDAGVEVVAMQAASLRAVRDNAEVAVAQAARWKGERDTAWELAESAVDRAARLESQRDTLQAKVDRMTSGLRAGRKPKVAASP